MKKILIAIVLLLSLALPQHANAQQSKITKLIMD